MSERKRTAPGDEIGAFTVIELAERRSLGEGKGTVVLWRVRCNLCGREDYTAITADLRRNKSCGCVPQERWTGPRSDEFKEKVRAGVAKLDRRGERNPNWRGDDAGYYAMHAYANRHFESRACDHCGTTDGRIEWAVKHGRKPSRDCDDWLRLCVRCHRFYDENPLATGRYWQERRSTEG